MTNWEDLLGEFIGLVAVIFMFSIPIVYIVMRSRRLHRAMELIHSERMAAIERGMELPTTSLEMLGDHLSQRRPRTALLPGLVWLFVGVAITASRLSIDGHDAPLMVGFIPAGIGLAYLIYYFVEERKQIQSSLETKSN